MSSFGSWFLEANFGLGISGSDAWCCPMTVRGHLTLGYGYFPMFDPTPARIKDFGNFSNVDVANIPHWDLQHAHADSFGTLSTNVASWARIKARLTGYWLCTEQWLNKGTRANNQPKNQSVLCEVFQPVVKGSTAYVCKGYIPYLELKATVEKCDFKSFHEGLGTRSQNIEYLARLRGRRQIRRTLVRVPHDAKGTSTAWQWSSMPRT
ncbi:uncharacterized protein FOMMEDRAFT_156416 [Fomitiporia mediterranea MF3/22]|uniref:uncharacterized protein n=1 Tax=Fomitiporia mediterranea (strain MF3/22) TaxID=694068 RepID=UPI0004408986|nr:uncharacterized protein FOMMEDRAFT_156416 [Fomitiporia mediterranea MF3/22]EJD03050.1 hypothetical protein FOMMEDRAFT_156416 [Fomitiporia mediterranea MF3/22]